ncbi:MAG: metal-dependent transcriptional regulator [Chitinophagales bacterium]
MQISSTEENYLKAIFSLFYKTNVPVSTNAIAQKMETAPASVTDMLKRLAEKELVLYEKYKGASLSKEGDFIAKRLVRKHRIWEVFLLEKLGFQWDEVHDVAEQLEHINSTELIRRLDQFLGFPKTDPHGDPIPDEEGNMAKPEHVKLTELEKNDTAIVVGVADTSTVFLQYLSQMGIQLGLSITVSEIFAFDSSIQVKAGDKFLMLSKQVSENLLVKKN